MEIVRVFDQLIFNTDRNLGNIVIDKQWRIWMIDHSRAFRMSHDIREPKNLTRCDRALLEKMKELTEPQLAGAMGEYLTKVEIQAILARRDKIVKHFEEKGSGSTVRLPSPASLRCHNIEADRKAGFHVGLLRGLLILAAQNNERRNDETHGLGR